MTSGARYHRVATYSVMYAFPAPPASGGGCADDRARPKSQICLGRVSFTFGKRSETYLEITVRVQEQVGRFQISMEDVGCVEGFEAAHRLVDEVLAVIVAEFLRPYDTVAKR